MPLAKAMESAHALFEAGRVPWNVEVHHDPGELKVDTLASGIRRQHEACGRRIRVLDPLLPPDIGGHEEYALFLALLDVHPAVDVSKLTGVSERFESLAEILKGVSVFCEDQQLLVSEFGGLR